MRDVICKTCGKVLATLTESDELYTDENDKKFVAHIAEHHWANFCIFRSDL